MSQASTQGVNSQQIFDSQQLDASIDDKTWGLLISTRKKSQVLYLTNSENTFGRGDVDFRFSQPYFDNQLLTVLSKVHFVISKVPVVTKSEDDYVIVLEDRSFNGTFINGTLGGKNKKKFLQNNDVISLATPSSKVFTFYDCFRNDSKDFPTELNERYIVMKQLGNGAYGEVRLAYSKATYTTVAMKIIKKKKDLTVNGTHPVKGNNISLIENEVKLLSSVDHPCIVKLLDIIDSPDYIYIIMDLAEGGELFDKISKTGRLSIATCKLYFYQLINAISYLHQKKIAHRDIKPENILLATEKEYTLVKLTDFGLSTKFVESLMTTFCGTVTYIAPELLLNENRHYTKKADMWSLGAVLYVCLLGHLPFNGDDDTEKIINIRKGNYNTNTKEWKTLPLDAKNLIENLLIVDYKRRLSAEEALNHEWFQDHSMLTQVNELFLKENSKSPVRASQKRRIDDAEPSSAQLIDKTPKLMSGIEFFDDEGR